MPIKVIRSAIFREQKQINAFVTLGNKDIFSDERNIPGLNLGFNTHETPEFIEQNRRALIREFHLDEEWIAFANQVHDTRVRVVTNGGTFPETDGLITQIRELALAIQIADCPAVLIFDPGVKIIAAVHAGWRGAAGGIVPDTVEKIVQLGADVERCKAFISPCISVENFEVGKEVAGQFPPSSVDLEHYDKPHVNLKHFLSNQLRRTGMKDKNIEIHPGCTVRDKQYYSYRREKEQSGRMMAVIQMR